MFTLLITYPCHRNLTASPQYAPKCFEAGDTPEEAAQSFKRQAQDDRRDLGLVVEILDKGGVVKHEDEETGRTVICKQLEGALV